MVQPNRRQPIERSPSKIAGIVYILVGFMALCIAAFVIFYRGVAASPTSNVWMGFGIVVALYGVFRIFTGLSMIKRAGGWKSPVMLNGNGSQPKPPLP